MPFTIPGMGMFDTIYLIDDDRVQCGHGHIQRTLQTKDLDAEMSSYHLFSGRLFYQDGDQEPVKESPAVENGMLVFRTVFSARPTSLSKIIVAYTHCTECQPVLTEANGFHYSDFTTHRPWLQYELSFDDGLLTGMVSLKAETREDVREKLIYAGLLPFPDTDRIAQKHFAQLKSGRRSSIF